MEEAPGAAAAAAILRRDNPGKPRADGNCPKCKSTVLSVSPDEDGNPTHDPKCPNCGYEV